jgi:tight adherence protein B
MTVLTVALALLFLLVVGAGLFAALVFARRARQALEARVSLVVRKPGVAVVAASAHAVPGLRETMGLMLRGWFAVGLQHDWGMHAGPAMLGLVALGGAAATWVLVGHFLHFSPAIAGVATVLAVFLAPRQWLKHEQSGADQKFVALVPDAIDMVIRMLRAGLPVTAAIRAVSVEASPPVDLVFRRIADQMSIGIPFEDALSVAAEQVGLADFRFFAVSISLQRATGGNLAVTLDILSDIMRKRRAMRLKGRAVTGEVRMSAYVLGAIPFFVIGAMLVVSPDYLAPMISDRRGNMILGIAALLLVLGFGSIRYLLRSVTKA